MAKPLPQQTRTVRDAKSGRVVTVRGAGALRGHLTISKGVDLTKPIAAQALQAAKTSKRDLAGKR